MVLLFEPGELLKKDVDAFSELAGGGLFYFPRSGRHARLMAEQAVENFRIQTERAEAQKELARWIRFRDEEVETYRDGISPDSMELSGIAGFYVRHFMTREDVLKNNFKKKGIDKTAVWAKEGGGWMVITSPDRSPAAPPLR